MRTLGELVLKPPDRAAIEEASRLLRERFPVEEVILFGSKARGDDDDESDIDLLVLTSRDLSRRERHEIVRALFPLQLAHDVVLSPLIVAASEWRDGLLSVHPIRSEVDEQGVAA